MLLLLAYVNVLFYKLLVKNNFSIEYNNILIIRNSYYYNSSKR